ncbi:hypothetical protein A9M93_05395 [Campylobacter lari]|nr:hypothetical protein [Campylobacter lari]
MSVDMSSKIDELAHNIGEVINRADALMDKFEKNEGDIAGIEEKLEKAATTDKDNSFSGNNSFEKPISIPEATKENEGINLGQADGRYGKLLTQNLELTVGGGGKFTKISDALKEAYKYKLSIGSTINIKLKSGFVWNEMVRVDNKDLSYISISSEDPEVTADGNIMTSPNSNQYFLSLFNSRGLIFNVLLNCINMSSTIYKHGIYSTNGSFICVSKGFGCKGANWNMSVTNGATANLYEAIFDNALNAGIFVQNSLANARQCSLKNCKGVGISSTIGGIINSNLCDFTGTSTKSNIPFNQVTKDGIIFNEGV